MKEYLKPILEEEDIEIEDVVANSVGVKSSPAGWDDIDDNGGDLGDILK